MDSTHTATFLSIILAMLTKTYIQEIVTTFFTNTAGPKAFHIHFTFLKLN